MNAILVVLIIFILCFAVRLGKLERRINLMEKKPEDIFTDGKQENGHS